MNLDPDTSLDMPRCSAVCVTQVGAFVIWYMHDSFLGIDLSKDGHSTVTWDQLTHWQSCPQWEGFTATSFTAGGSVVSFDNPCDYFTTGWCWH